MISLTHFDQLQSISLEGLELIMFDMDGTLIKSEHFHAQVTFSLLESSPYKSAQEIEDKFHGESDEFVHCALKQYMKGLGLNEFIKIKTARVLDQMINGLPTVAPKVVQFIQRAKKQGIKVNLVTSSQREVMNKILEAWELRQYFDYVRAYEDNAENKPLPAPYISSAQDAQVNADKAIIFEDSPVGIKAALAYSPKEVYQVSWYS